MVAFSRFGRNAYKGENSNNIAFVVVFSAGWVNFHGWEEWVRNPSETDSIGSRISSETSSGKKDGTKDAIKDTTSDSQVNSCFPYRWPPASLTLNLYFYLFT